MNRKEKLLKDLKLYIEALNFIDSKTSSLEHAESEYEYQKKEYHKITHKFKGLNILLYWIIFSIISLFPCSLLNSIIATEFNFIYLVPIVSTIALILYINKNTNTIQKKQVTGMKKNLKMNEDKLKDLIGEINYTKSLAEQLLHRMFEDKNHQTDLLTISDVLLNLEALNYMYESINRDISTTLETAIENFNVAIETTKKDKLKADVIEDFRQAELKAKFRTGVLKRCIKEQAQNENPPQ